MKKIIVVNSKENSVKVQNVSTMSISSAFGNLSNAISDVQNACDKLIETLEDASKGPQATSAVRSFEKNLVNSYVKLLELKK
jgi:hypothetical protein